MFVGADAERSCSRRRSVTDAACPSRVLIGPLLQFCIALSFLNVGADDSVRPQRPPLRQKKPAAFRFRRGGENSISAASFFLSKPEPFHWVPVWLTNGGCRQRRLGEFFEPILFFLCQKEIISTPFPFLLQKRKRCRAAKGKEDVGKPSEWFPHAPSNGQGPCPWMLRRMEVGDVR